MRDLEDEGASDYREADALAEGDLEALLVGEKVKFVKEEVETVFSEEEEPEFQVFLSWCLLGVHAQGRQGDEKCRQKYLVRLHLINFK